MYLMDTGRSLTLEEFYTTSPEPNTEHDDPVNSVQSSPTEPTESDSITPLPPSPTRNPLTDDDGTSNQSSIDTSSIIKLDNSNHAASPSCTTNPRHAHAERKTVTFQTLAKEPPPLKGFIDISKESRFTPCLTSKRYDCIAYNVGERALPSNEPNTSMYHTVAPFNRPVTTRAQRKKSAVQLRTAVPTKPAQQWSRYNFLVHPTRLSSLMSGRQSFRIGSSRLLGEVPSTLNDIHVANWYQWLHTGDQRNSSNKDTTTQQKQQQQRQHHQPPQQQQQTPPRPHHGQEGDVITSRVRYGSHEQKKDVINSRLKHGSHEQKNDVITSRLKHGSHEQKNDVITSRVRHGGSVILPSMYGGKTSENLTARSRPDYAHRRTLHDILWQAKRSILY